MTRRGRVIVGFLLAPLTPAVILTPLLMIGYGALSGIAVGIYALAVDAVVVYPIALVVGLPLHMLARSRGWSGGACYLAAGAAFGGVALLVWAACDLVGDPSAELFDTVPAVVAGVIAGGLVTTCFWLIARPDRP